MINFISKQSGEDTMGRWQMRSTQRYQLLYAQQPNLTDERAACKLRRREERREREGRITEQPLLTLFDAVVDLSKFHVVAVTTNSTS